MTDGLNAWEKETIKENSRAIRSIETDAAITQKDIVTNKEDVKRIEERLIEHKVKSETAINHLVGEVQQVRETFSGFKGEIKGSINTLKVIIPLSFALISTVAGAVVWFFSTTGTTSS